MFGILICQRKLTDAFWVKLISKNRNTLEIEHSLFNSPIIISIVDFILHQLILLTNPIHRILGHFVNKLPYFSYQKYLWIFVN